MRLESHDHGDHVEHARRGATVNSEHEARFCEFVAARQHALLRTAYLLTSDHHAAEDLVQTALAKAYLSWHKLREPAAADRYVRRIMVNENTSLWRRAWKRNEVTTDEVPERGAVAHEHDHGEKSALWDFVQTLPKRQRAVIVLRYYEELSEAETAEILGISVGTVKSQASRALAAMRERVHTQPTLNKDAEEDR
jgi:RNA polymerase sigma-70 factor (sigma-E family)